MTETSRLGRRIFFSTIVVVGALSSSFAAAQEKKAPEFTHAAPSEWINSPPLSIRALRGKVVLLEFWAFKCSNCLSSQPWLEAMAQSQQAAGLIVIGVHTPELDSERDPAQVRRAVKRLDIHHPVMIDADASYWNELHNRFWPTFYLIGRDGALHGSIVGEIREGDSRASQIEAAVDLLLK